MAIPEPADAKGHMLAAASSFMLGLALPVALAPASKSSPLFLALSALLALAAVVQMGRLDELKSSLAQLGAKPAMWLSATLVGLMAISTIWTHNISSAGNQLIQFLIPLLTGLVLCLAFPLIAPQGRLKWWLVGAAATGLIVALDINSGLKFRELTGGRLQAFTYNRALVTLAVILWPLLALVAARRQPMLALPLIAVPIGIYAGESQTAVLGLVAGLSVFPIAWFLPKLTRSIGIVAVLGVLAVSPVFGTLSTSILGAGFHKAMQAAHTDERVQIWMSFEAAAQKRLILGNGFGSTLDMHNSPVAKEVPGELVKMLGASHPHNAFLQIWAELGAVGAVLAALLLVSLFRAIGRMPALLQPFMLTYVAVACAIALISHGAWQAWWVAALAAGAAGFLAVARELDDKPAL